METQAKEDLQALLQVLPAHVRAAILDIGNETELLEVVMDLGRQPTARYVSGERVLTETEITKRRSRETSSLQISKPKVVVVQTHLLRNPHVSSVLSLHELCVESGLTQNCTSVHEENRRFSR